MSRLLLCVLTTVALIVILTGCGGGDESSGTTDTPESTPRAAATDTTDTTEREPSFQNTFEYGLEQGDGETLTVTLEVGEILKAAEASDLGFTAPACKVDPERDAVIPARVTVRNTTSGFDVDAAVGVTWEPGGNLLLGSDDYCEGSGVTIAGDRDGSNNLISSTGLSPDSEATADVAFVEQSYFSPANPEGDQSELEQQTFLFGGGLGRKGTCISGPGVAMDGSFSILGEEVSPAGGEVSEKYQLAPC